MRHSKNKRALPLIIRSFALSAMILSVLTTSVWISSAEAQTLNCSGPQRVEQSFANGARWSMCWENRSREGIVFKDVYYSPPGGAAVKILAQAGLAQIHVPYDDDGARFHDVSDFGLGSDSNLNNLTANDCVGGTRLALGGKNMICKQVESQRLGWIASDQQHVSQTLRLFSVSHVGAYNYIAEWLFFDDGTLEPAIGATGNLQRRGNDSDYGWPLNSSSDTYGISHMHNYYWRLDFDLGENGTDERIEELTAQLQAGNTQRRVSVLEISQEQARRVEPQTMRFWRIRDTALFNSAGKAISVDILPIETGHRGSGPGYEPFTNNDVYFTRFRACERFATHNPSDSAGGCTFNQDVTNFVNGEGLVGQDTVVWFGLSFHHVPKDEDEPFMHSHWNRFRIQPRDLYVSLEGPDTDSPNPTTPTCGQPDYDTATDKALFIWRSCTNANEWHTLVTAAGTGLNSHAGQIYTTTGYSAITGLSIEAPDRVGLVNSTTLEYDLRTVSPWKDEFKFSVNGNADICFNAQTIPASTDIFVGGNRVPVSSRTFNPDSLENCTPPDVADVPVCGRPNIDTVTDRALFIWKECANNDWYITESASSSESVSDNYVGFFESSAGISSADPIGLESSDTLSFSGNRVDFDIRTVRPWTDDIQIRPTGAGSACLTLTSRPSGVVTYVGQTRLPVAAARFDPTDLGACN